VGIVQPYPAEWDTTPYLPKFKASTLHTFDDKGSPNQYVYYFKSQTGNVVSNDAILARLSISTLKGVTFEWFMKLPIGSIKTWADLEKLFLAYFFEDDSEISVPTLLAAKQKKEESIKTFVERFKSIALHRPSGMTQSTLVETCRHNLQTSLLAQMEVAECHTWKQLVLQGEQAEEIVSRVRAEEKDSKLRPDKPMRRTPESSSQWRRRDTLKTEVKSPSKTQLARGGMIPG